MKKIKYILILAFFNCSPPEDLPTPIQKPIIEEITPTEENKDYFLGSWNCQEWVVDEITGATRKRTLIFSEPINDSPYILALTMRSYIDSFSFNELYAKSSTLIDSSYFNNSFNPIDLKFKGNILTDTTMIVYHYDVDALGYIDTLQTQIFTKE